jgi:hypothetical protein
MLRIINSCKSVEASVGQRYRPEMGLSLVTFNSDILRIMHSFETSAGKSHVFTISSFLELCVVLGREMMSLFD